MSSGKTRQRQRSSSENPTHQHPEYRTKCIAILSHYPFFQSFKKALKLLYRIALGGQSIVPLERYISNLVLSVPLPSPGTNVVLDWGLGDSNAIVFRRPEREDLPMLGVSFLPLFHMLSLPSIVSVWNRTWIRNFTLLILHPRILVHPLIPLCCTLKPCLSLSLILFFFSFFVDFRLYIRYVCGH